MKVAPATAARAVHPEQGRLKLDTDLAAARAPIAIGRLGAPRVAGVWLQRVRVASRVDLAARVPIEIVRIADQGLAAHVARVGIAARPAHRILLLALLRRRRAQVEANLLLRLERLVAARRLVRSALPRAVLVGVAGTTAATRRVARFRTARRPADTRATRRGSALHPVVHQIRQIDLGPVTARGRKQRERRTTNARSAR